VKSKINVLNQKELNCMTDKSPEKLNFTSASTSPFCIAKGDTGATSHYWTERDKGILNNVKNFRGPSVQLPDSTMIPSTKQGELPISQLLSKKATQTSILPNLQSANLISLGQLCDDGCIIHLDKNDMKVIKNNTTVLRGLRNHSDGLWDIPIYKSTITPNCCIQPIKQGMLCATQISKPITKCIFKPRTNHNNIPTHLQLLSCLAMDNDFHNAIDKQLRIDDKYDKSSNNMNIIIRKKETHMNLVRYLHAV
jgi:hypothetical protein